MSLQINTFDDLIQIINTHPDWRRWLVKALFPEIDLPKALQELIESNRLMRAQLGDVEGRLKVIDDRLTSSGNLQTRMEKIIIHLDERQTRLENYIMRMDERQTRSDARQDRTDEHLGNLEHSVAWLKGESHENTIARKANGIFGYVLLRGHDSRNEIGEQLHEAEESGKISGQDVKQVLAVDLLWSGKLKKTKENATLVVEVSAFAEQYDIERAIARAAILSQAGMQAFPVVAAKEWHDDILKTARQKNVIIVQDAGLNEESWDSRMLA